MPNIKNQHRADLFFQYILKALRKIYTRQFRKNRSSKMNCITDTEAAAQLMYDCVSSDQACMIARFGSTEMTCLCNYLGVKSGKKDIVGYIQGKTFAWWWEKNIIEQMQRWSGFFPPEEKKIEQFCEMMLQDTKEVNILGSWLETEKYVKKELQQASLITFTFLDPYWSKTPWTKALEGKKVLVVHPFAKSIEAQYKKRELLFENKDILPAFELKTIQAVQSLGGGNDTPFADWFEALEYMKSEIDKTDYDICLIGAGAYGFPLAAHVKRMGKKGIHLGGKLQLLFGIKGKRWENENYSDKYNFAKLMNQHWVRPLEEEKPKTAENVEGACYW